MAEGKMIIFTLITLSLWTREVRAFSYEQEVDVLSKLPPPRYNKWLHPKTSVELKINRMNVVSFDEQKMEVTLDFTLYQKWEDDRLKYDRGGGYYEKSNYIPLNANDIWTPDTTFLNQRRKTEIERICRVFPEGKIQLMTVYQVTYGFPMNFKRYPHDKHTFPLVLVSNHPDVKFTWWQDEENPVQFGVIQVDDSVVVRRTVKAEDPEIQGKCKIDLFSDNASLPIEEDDDNFVPFHTDSREELSCVYATIEFRRQFGYFLVQVYIPCVMLVLLSFTSFWIDRKHVTARVIIGLATTLVLATQVSAINSQQFPLTPYTKRVDIWTGICLTFTFCAFLEFCTVQYTAMRDGSAQKSKTDPESGGETEIPLSQTPECPAGEINQSKEKQGKIATLTRDMDNYMREKFFTEQNSKGLDKYSKVVFPVAFAAFMILYAICSFLL